MASLKLPMVLLAGMLISAPALRGEDMLPPPPPGDDMMMPPPPGGDMMAPPPPGGDMLPPPGGDMMAPPGGDMFAPPGGDMMAPPPGGDMMAPPPGGDMMAPPPGGDMMAPPGGDLAPPPGDAMFPEPAPVTPSSGKTDSYRVARGDSLWRISGKDRIYGDSFQWPLLFIANRDRIKDPDTIQPSWNLKVRRNLGADEIASAVEKAKETPRYVPHVGPRRRLPIDY